MNHRKTAGEAVQKKHHICCTSNYIYKTLVFNCIKFAKNVAPEEKETSKKKSEKHILTRWCTSRQQKLAKETRRTRQSTASAKHRLKHASRACNPGTVEGAWGFSTPYPYPTMEGCV